MPRLALAALLLLAAAIPADLKAQTAYDQYRQQLQGAATADAPGAPQQAAGASRLGIDWDLPGFDDIVADLKEQGLGALKSCDYQRYFEIGNALLEDGLDAFKPADGGAEDPDQDWALPFMDPVADFLRIGEVVATKKSAGAEATGMAYTLEQVCNSVVQADEINRTHQIVKNGRLSVGNLIDWALDEARFSLDYGQGGVRVDADVSNLYANLVQPARTPSDSLWDAVHASIDGTIEASNNMSESLDALERDLDVARRSLFHYAERDEDGNWTCPEEDYPDWAYDSTEWEDDPSDSDVLKPICGPASPERSQQVLAGLELKKTQLRTIQMSADSRLLEVEAMRLMADNLERKLEASVGVKTITGGM